MASLIDIANRALSKLGEARITSLDDDNKASRAMKAAIYIVRDSELRDHLWHFSKTRITLPALAATPAFGWAYAYQKPSDLIRVIQVGLQDPAVNLDDYRYSGTREWELEGNTILSNFEAPLYLRYVARIEDTSLYDASFVEVLANRLAFETCTELTQSQTIKEGIAREWQVSINKAVLNNAVELPPQDLQDLSWVMGRI